MLKHTHIYFALTAASSLSIMTMGCDHKGTGECTQSSDCAPGYACAGNSCRLLCLAQSDCESEQICLDGFCTAPTGTAVPEITSVVGNATNAPTRIADGLIVSGSLLREASFELRDEAGGVELLAVRNQDAQRVEVLLPTNVRQGLHTLAATNASGTTEASVTLELPDLTADVLVDRINAGATKPFAVNLLPAHQHAPSDLTAQLSFEQWDTTTHGVVSSQISLGEYLCIIRHGVWDASTGKCNSPLAYSASLWKRDPSITNANINSDCPADFIVADCATAAFLLQFWRLSPQVETAEGSHEAWCFASLEAGAANSDLGQRGTPGFWYGEPTRTIAPKVCEVGNALTIDQARGSLISWVLHMYCRDAAEEHRWMCMSTKVQ